MDMIKAVAVFCISTVFMVFSAFALAAEMEHPAPENAPEVRKASAELVLDAKEAGAVSLYECNTRTYISGRNSSQKLPAGHLAKLMVFLIAAEKIRSGELELDSIVTVSNNANSQNDPQIWLDAGEKVSVSDLLKAVTIGNANDAAVAIAEKISGKVTDFTALMNLKATALGMLGTTFSDPTGMEVGNITTADDICKLCAELVKYKDFSEYFTTRLDTVRDGKTELVSRNKLLRNQKGILGFKVCSGKESGVCAALCIQKDDMTVCFVVLGAKNEDEVLGSCPTMLNSVFSEYEVYYPEIPDELCLDIPVKLGTSTKCRTYMPMIRPVLIHRGSYKSISCTFSVAESAEAPVFRGESFGSIVYKVGDEVLLSSDICSDEYISKVGFVYTLKRVLSNLLNLS